MDFIFLGGEVPSHKKLLVDMGVKHIGLNYSRLVKRGLPKTKDYLIEEYFPEDVSVYVYAGAVPEDLGELDAFVAEYHDFCAINSTRLTMASEIDSPSLRSQISSTRLEFWDNFGDKFMPIWHKEYGYPELVSLSEKYRNVGISGKTIDADMTLSGRVRALQSQFDTSFHGVSVSNPNNLRQVSLETASSLAWVSPMMRGETIVWDGSKLVRYQKKMKDQARARYKGVAEKAGLDFNLILEDDSSEVTRLAVWSYLQLEESLNRKNLKAMLSDNSEYIDDPGDSETGWVEPDNKGVEVRKLSLERDVSELRTLPVFSVSTKTIIEKDDSGRDVIKDAAVLSSNTSSLRQCNTCFVASNCPAMKPDSACAFNLPIEVKTKDQLKSLLNAIIEMQGQRVAFMRFSEEMNGGYADPNTSQEIDRLFKIVKSLKELEENKEFVRMTVERQTSGGVMSALFGDKAGVLKEIPNGGISEEQTTRIISENLEK